MALVQLVCEISEAYDEWFPRLSFGVQRVERSTLIFEMKITYFFSTSARFSNIVWHSNVFVDSQTKFIFRLYRPEQGDSNLQTIDLQKKANEFL